MPYKRNATLTSPIARMHAAREHYAAKDEAWRDEGAVLKRAVRAELAAMSEIAYQASKIWENENKLVLSPAACGSREIHPTRAKALAEFVEAQGWSADYRESIVPMRSEREIAEALRAETRARYERADAALVAYEAARHFETMGTWPKGYVPPGDEPEIEPAVISETETPRRRGRPPGSRVSLDPAASDADLPVERG